MKNKYICITPFFPSKHSCEGIFIYDQILEIKKQTNLDILIIKLSSIYKNEDSYNYKGISVNIFKLLDLRKPSNASFEELIFGPLISFGYFVTSFWTFLK